MKEHDLQKIFEKYLKSSGFGSHLSGKSIYTSTPNSGKSSFGDFDFDIGPFLDAMKNRTEYKKLTIVVNKSDFTIIEENDTTTNDKDLDKITFADDEEFYHLFYKSEDTIKSDIKELMYLHINNFINNEIEKLNLQIDKFKQLKKHKSVAKALRKKKLDNINND